MSEKHELLSGPSEHLTQHLELILDQWSSIDDRFQATLPRLFGASAEKTDKAIRRMLLLHDLGKATEKWQNYISGIKPGKEEQDEQHGKVPHAQLGGAYLWWAFGKDKEKEPGYDLVMASAFAIAIHHTDQALARPGVEDPATLLVTRGLVDESNDTIRWHEGLKGFVEDLRKYDELTNMPDPNGMDVYAVSGFALALREWARGASILELHRRRLQVAALHSVIKICDIRAAKERSDEQVFQENTFIKTIVKGGMRP